MPWIAALLAFLSAWSIDRLASRRGFDPPGFEDPTRRLLASLVLSFYFFVGIFGPAMTFGQQPVDIDSLHYAQAFLSQVLLAGTLAAWLALGFLAVSEVSLRRRLAQVRRALGLRARNIEREILVGLGTGIVAWAMVLAAAFFLGLVLLRLSSEKALAQEPSELVIWMAGLPIAIRLAISLVAGVVEEVFFRGFLQQRIGILASSILFVGGHLSYGQPLMLFGLTLLSLFYAGLTQWRGSVWAAATAHFLFDAVQLLIVIPAVLEAYARSVAVAVA